jgi:carbon monoxide dehydrogenase subunit G
VAGSDVIEPGRRWSVGAAGWRGPYPGSVRPSVFTYERGHRFALPPDRLWDRIDELDQFERWWPWLTDLRIEGSGLTTGTVLSGVVNPPLPYRMRLRVELVNCVRPHSIDARVSGDLTGDARLRLRPDGRGTLVEAAWTIEVHQPAMRLASRIGRPVLQWGHDRVVDMTVAGFRRRIERE